METGTGDIPTGMLFTTAGTEFVLTKLDHNFSWATPQKGLFKNVNSNRRTRNHIGLLLSEAGHLTKRDTKWRHSVMSLILICAVNLAISNLITPGEKKGSKRGRTIKSH